MEKFWVKEIRLLNTTYYQVMVRCKYSDKSNPLRGACYKKLKNAIERCKIEEIMHTKTYTN